jgi:hypothetical protein
VPRQRHRSPWTLQSIKVPDPLPECRSSSLYDPGGERGKVATTDNRQPTTDNGTDN